MDNSPRNQPPSNLPPGLGAPAQRALAQAGYQSLEQLAAVREADLKQLHGIGPKALETLRRALAEKGLTFLPD
ncbi:MAG: DNA-binding protein [Anaerolineae bacterium]|nr:DNA-binding protein [Anaerolineae bacterium]